MAINSSHSAQGKRVMKTFSNCGSHMLTQIFIFNYSRQGNMDSQFPQSSYNPSKKNLCVNASFFIRCVLILF